MRLRRTARLKTIRETEGSAADQIRSLAIVMGISGATWGLLPLFAHPDSTQWRAVVVLWIFGNQSVMTAVCSPAKSVFAAAVGSVTLTSAVTMAVHGESFDFVLAFLIILGGAYSASIFSAMSQVATGALRGRLIAQDLASSLTARQNALGIANERLARLANEDVLTPTLNRRGFIAAIASDGEHVKASGWVGVIDIDGFKAINDTYGHQAGDQVLEICARRWRNALPDGALLARMGGDEFAVTLPTSSESDALMHGTKLACALAEPIVTQPDSVVTVGCSIGLTAVEAGESLSAAIGRADKALYTSKQTGRPSVWQEALSD